MDDTTRQKAAAVRSRNAHCQKEAGKSTILPFHWYFHSFFRGGKGRAFTYTRRKTMFDNQTTINGVQNSRKMKFSSCDRVKFLGIFLSKNFFDRTNSKKLHSHSNLASTKRTGRGSPEGPDTDTPYENLDCYHPYRFRRSRTALLFFLSTFKALLFEWGWKIPIGCNP